MLFLLIFFALCPAKAYSQDYFILNHSNYSYKNNQLDIDLFFSLNNIEDLQRIVKSGTSININFSSVLHEASFLFDKEVQEYITGWQIRFEALTHEYILYFENQPPKRSHDLASLLATTLKNKSFSFYNLPKLDLDKEHYLEIHINMQQATNPPWLESTLFFWTWDAANLNYRIDLKI